MKPEAVSAPLRPADLLTCTRLPGPFGPIVRLEGSLDERTADRFREAVDVVWPLGHRTVTLNLSGLEHIDIMGMAALIEACRQMKRVHVRPVLVVGTGSGARLVARLGFERFLIVTVTEDEARDALEFLYGERTWPDRSWGEARSEALDHWRRLELDLDVLPETDIARRLTRMHALCEKSDDAFRLEEEPGSARCEVCPLFHDLGGKETDLGCNSAIDPILAALFKGDTATARRGMERVVNLLESMPDPEMTVPAPVPAALWHDGWLDRHEVQTGGRTR